MEVKGVVWSWSFVLFCGLTQKVVEFCVIGTYSSVFQDQGETDIPVLNDILVQKELLAFLFLSILGSSLTLGVCFLLCVTPFYLKVSFCFFLLPLSSFFFFFYKQSYTVPSQTGTYCVDQTGLEFTQIHLPLSLPPGCQD